MLSQTLVISGIGKAVVAAVGKNSRRGVHETKIDTESKTPLQNKLENLGGIFTKWGIYASIAILIANFVNLTFTLIFNERYRQDTAKVIKSVADYLTLSITIIIVAVPEGLPLAVSLSLAYSVRRMKDDQILVKNLNAPEIMGTVEEICTGKTATLTANEMKVRQFYAQNKLIHNDRKNTLLNCELEQSTLELIKEGILFNTETRIEMADNALYIPVGNGTEVGLVKFLQDAEVPVHEIIPRKLDKILTQIPFSADRKRSTVALRHPDLEDVVRVYVKGAPEYIAHKCTSTVGPDGRRTALDEEQLNYILKDVLFTEYTSKGYRALAFAYKDLSIEEFENYRQECNNFKDITDREVLESNLTFVAAFALQDDLRQRVLRSVRFAQRGYMNVRMVSGDNLETATAVAIKAGIITEEESKLRYTCMAADEFRKLVGGMRKTIGPDGNERMEI